LLQYNHGDSFSVQQLQENTQIDTVCRLPMFISVFLHDRNWVYQFIPA